MDIVAICFYGVVCGVLGLLAPVFGNFFLRLLVGVGVGVGSAVAMPSLRPLIEELLVLYAPGLMSAS
ncbi:MAG: hypothetical protein AAGA78_13265 [Pseudomonadota bacterium]